MSPNINGNIKRLSYCTHWTVHQNSDPWEPKVAKLIKSVNNGSVSFMINLNFDIQNLIDFRSFGTFPKIRSWKKLTKSSTSTF